MDAATDAKTIELRHAHDGLAEFYAERFTNWMDVVPADRRVLDLFCDLVVASGLGTRIGDVGCGPGRLAPYLAERGLAPHGVDLSPEMIRVARRDHPDVTFEVGDLRALPFADDSLAGVVGWYSLMYLAPDDRAGAFAELARVVAPGGYLAIGFKVGEGEVHRAGRFLDFTREFDVYWYSTDQLHGLLTAAGFDIVFHAGRPAGPDEFQPQGYALARRR